MPESLNLEAATTTSTTTGKLYVKKTTLLFQGRGTFLTEQIEYEIYFPPESLVYIHFLIALPIIARKVHSVKSFNPSLGRRRRALLPCCCPCPAPALTSSILSFLRL